MENFITGYASSEQDHRARIRGVLGEQQAAAFFERFLEAFFRREDAAFVRRLGMNAVRIPVNYRHLQDDAEPATIREHGFRHLDRAVELCGDEGLYTIIDLHALPGYQNQAWHSDNPTHRAGFWGDRVQQERVIGIWRAIAARYRGVSSVAGYNPVNEPGDVDASHLVPFYAELAAAIREIDPEHILFLEGNRYALDFDLFGDPLPNTVYTLHDYALPGYPDGGPYPGVSRGEFVDRAVVEQKFLERSRYMRETGTPIWVGEFGPVYPPPPEGHSGRLAVLRDQLDIYDRYGASWSIWTFKDVGLQGLVTVAPDSPWMRRVGGVVEKKLRLGADSWASTDSGIRDVMAPIEDLMDREFPAWDPFPFGRRWMIKRLVRHILIAEPLEIEFAECFRGLGDADIEPLMASFELEHCVPREALLDLLRSNLVAPPSRT
jgi:aryl-phospho-beta-D-glucosidase BglC (GH1 family)